jgi:citrate lyase beta subunit
MGELARRALQEYAPTPAALAQALGASLEFAETDLARAVYDRVTDKLSREPVEDYRIDFEDGYGVRPAAEEDAAALNAATETAAALAEGTLPPFFGIRIKPLTTESKARAMRTLERYLGALTAQTKGKLPPLRITLPKITRPKQVRALAEALKPFPTAQIEIMVETPQAILRLEELVDAAEGRCVAAHFGPYDYTASLGIVGPHQDLRHPACDFARSMMLVALAGRDAGRSQAPGVSWSDGPTTALPVPVHRGEELDPEQFDENHRAVHHAWKLHYRNIRHALVNGFYQGWDLHPAQLPVRYAAVFTFFLEGVDQASARLRNFIAQAAQATRVGGVFDDAATAQGLLGYFLRAVDCGAIPEADAPAITGLTLDELRSASFTKILAGRAAAPKQAPQKQAPREQTAKEQAPQEQASPEQVSPEQVSQDQAPKEQAPEEPA